MSYKGAICKEGLRKYADCMACNQTEQRIASKTARLVGGNYKENLAKIMSRVFGHAIQGRLFKHNPNIAEVPISKDAKGTKSHVRGSPPPKSLL